ncbi:Ig domain-containing protein [Arcobacter sp. FWKO B]|uniref:Ig domain-containing protein n=1 Tax=Arcobacter sp. FWKO B TaxID=2593672 RepID=UPI0018A38A2E|nr:Ig domain-containing protein [Arcobacter sp. FWKO B]QOG11628.1 hypothetical protein FWKOB_02450 [Arcobacter sp. FWKO B]
MKKRAFTVVELAVVLIIIGLLVGGGVGIMGVLTQKAKLSETRQSIEALEQSILGYVQRTKRLPNTLNTLGIKTTDAYNKSIQYFTMDEIDNICDQKPENYLQVQDNTLLPSNLKTDIAFILIADGENRCNQTGDNIEETFIVSNQYESINCLDGTAGQYDDIVRYMDIDGLRKLVCSAFNISTYILPTGTQWEYYTANLGASDGVAPYVWSLDGGSSLPMGLSITGSNISGTPEVHGSYNFTVVATDAEGKVAKKNLNITLSSNLPRIVTDYLAFGIKNVNYPNTALSADGGKPGGYTWNLVSGALPPGLLLLDQWIYGQPTTEGTYSFTVSVTDTAMQTTTKTLSIAINPQSTGGGGGEDPPPPPPPPGVCVPGKEIFTYTGTMQYFTVPEYCTKLTFKVWGAGGGGGTSSTGGAGGYANGELNSVEGGWIYNVLVGGGGVGVGMATGGYGGGGNGGVTGGQKGAGAGGRSEVSGSSSVIITAGGGGGGGVSNAGGGGGGNTGYNGLGTNSGQGGTQIAAGAGYDGGSGSNGGNATVSTNNQNGGGGGGGYFGGGAGRGTTDRAGGGGGSGYIGGVANGINQASTTQTPPNNADTDYILGIGVGANSAGVGGNGLVVIYYE